MKKYISNSEEETRKAAAEIAAGLKPGDVIALNGDLGAGKTAFVKGIAEYFSCEDDVTSPTFTLVNEYGGDVCIYHFDVYRLENPSIEECDWMDDYFFGDGICIIEWADNIKSVLPADSIRIDILKDPLKGEDYREIIVC
ncbi:MAG TPA: tRNA (adenosine(37)-N6)-threonylcarbamoyltransferase complex ATPase subunit type 1 TsaE [Firmicutes bacterium]|nr:tRNA (adenosine(37)-N6)-threonylcarbamoyltransferase complex ATPase subunit type 1 TsaE [Bacillota bacterium]